MAFLTGVVLKVEQGMTSRALDFIHKVLGLEVSPCTAQIKPFHGPRIWLEEAVSGSPLTDQDVQSVAALDIATVNRAELLGDITEWSRQNGVTAIIGKENGKYVVWIPDVFWFRFLITEVKIQDKGDSL